MDEDADRKLAAIRELCEYVAVSPRGWCGESDELAEDVLSILAGDPISQDWQDCIAHAKASGWDGPVRVQCPDFPRCEYAVTAGSSWPAEHRMADHIAHDPRHTGGEWIDRDGRSRVGFGLKGE
jgi:hypothetical protein